MKNLDSLRGIINETDDRILELFADRMRTAAKIAIVKKAAGMPVFVLEREQEVLKRMSEHPAVKMLGDETNALFSLIMRLSVKLQSEAKFMNIVLTGMPGCGKTVIGRRVASTLGLRFMDVDTMIEEREGMPVFRIFESKGEAYFRDVEKKMIAECTNAEYAVISTGGGAVLDSGNISALKATGDIYFIDRPPESIVTDIDTAERPLLKGGPQLIFRMYDERIALYRDTCTFRIDNSGRLKEAVDTVVDTAAQAMLDRRALTGRG